MTSSFSLEAVSCGYRHGMQLRDVSAQLHTGQVCAILGPNGAGKTTLLRGIVGLLPLTGGSVRVDNAELSSLPAVERARRVAYVPQSASLPSGLTVTETLQIAAYPQGYQPWSVQSEASPRLQELLSAFRLSGLAQRQASSLSGGELRRLMLAQGLMQLGPSGGVLLLDEPTAFLDPPARRYIAEAATRTALEEQRIVLTVLHEPELALAYATHFLLLRDGRSVGFGPCEEFAGSKLLEQLYEESLPSTDESGVAA